MRNEKAKLPKFVCDWLDQHKEELCGYPMTDIRILTNVRNPLDDASPWVFCKGIENQWKLIDALRYGYESEPEPRWGIKAGYCYMIDSCLWRFANVTPELVIDCEADFDEKYEADKVVNKLGFGEVVDLNKEGKADD
ncbi:hypothetical protein [Latilactobacillus sakei]|uniref:hypothetical protein n=1 Tax=Latilactobacillus sakei TaxID=1599 RepID=UPI000978D8CA|nr:hypothetical protein [Latilactobacillus sakei]